MLGCGPTGLLAAYAADRFGGADVRIFSKKRKSEMFGAMYLHEEIPGIPLPDPVQVSYGLKGSVHDYRAKVYGPDYLGSVSADSLLGTHAAWDIRAAYGWLWHQYADRIENYVFDRSRPTDMGALLTGADMVINSMPRHVLCHKSEHKFQAQEVWGIGDAPERGIFSPVKVPMNSVVLNGEPDASWYRASNVYGYNTVEYPNLRNRKPPIEGIAKIVKPLKTNCDCWPGMIHVGRYGKWQKGVLSHEAFTEVLKEIVG